MAVAETGLERLQRSRKHIERLRDRRDYLADKMENLAASYPITDNDLHSRYETQEIAAIDWALPILEAEWDTEARLRRDHLDPLDIALISSACRARAETHRRTADSPILDGANTELAEQAAATLDRLASLFNDAAAVFVVGRDCSMGHKMVQPEGPGRFYECERGCGTRSHIRGCIDPEEGTITCICGFDRIEADEAEAFNRRMQATQDDGLIRKWTGDPE